MTISGAMSFTVDSYLTTKDAQGNTIFVQLKGSCSDTSVKFKNVTVGISTGATVSPPTNPKAPGLSVNIPQAEFDHLVECLAVPPVLVTIGYDLIDNKISATSLACTPILAGFQLLEQISAQTDKIPQIAKAQESIDAHLSHIEKLLHKAIDQKN